MEGKIVKQTEDEIELKTSLGIIGIKIKDIEEIIKADYVPEIKWIEEVPVETLPIIETQPITPSATVTSTDTALTEPTPFKVGIEAQNPAQEEINALVEKLANLEAGQEPWNLVRQLAGKGDEEITYLLSLMNNIQEPDILCHLIYAIGNTRNQDAIKPLLDKIKSEHEKVRSAVINALAKFSNDPVVIRVLRVYLNEEKSERVRISLINTLTSLEDVGALPDFVNLLNDANRSIRYAASNAIVKLHQLMVAESEGEPEIDVVSLLLGRLRRADTLMKKGILTLLGQLKDPRALEALVDLLSDSDAGIRALSAMALGGLNDPKANQYIVERLEEEDDNATKIQLILALQNTRDFSVIPALIELLEDPDANVKFGAGRALRTITKRSYGTNYERWQDWWDTFRGK